MERTFLQIAVALAACVPVGAGLGGIVYGPQFLELPNSASSWSHVHYLAGLLLTIGLIFWASIPRIEHCRDRFALLTLIVFVGGLARLIGAVALGDAPGKGMMFALTMELIVTPALWAWQRKIAVS
jgi:hypothetical protein